MPGSIAPTNRVAYVEAIAITGRSKRYLAQLAQNGALTREGGASGQAYHTWLSRSEVEALALDAYRQGRAAFLPTASASATGYSVETTSSHW